MKKILALLAVIGFVAAAHAGDGCCPASKGKDKKAPASADGKPAPAESGKKTDKPA